MAQEQQRQEKQFRLTGAHVLALLVAFFGIVFTVNGYLIYQAQRSWTGLMPGNGYEASLKYNKEAARARALLAKGWHTKVLVPKDGRIIIELTDRNGEPVIGLLAKAKVARPVGTADDRTLTFTERSIGRYVADAALPAGAWRMNAEFTRKGELQWRASADFIVPER